MSARKIEIECDNCGCREFVAYRLESESGTTIYVECDGCGASVVTARAEP